MEQWTAVCELFWLQDETMLMQRGKYECEKLASVKFAQPTTRKHRTVRWWIACSG